MIGSLFKGLRLHQGRLTINNGLKFKAEKVKAQHTDKRAVWRDRGGKIPPGQGWASELYQAEMEEVQQDDEHGLAGLKGSLEKVQMSCLETVMESWQCLGS